MPGVASWPPQGGPAGPTASALPSAPSPGARCCGARAAAPWAGQSRCTHFLHPPLKQASLHPLPVASRLDTIDWLRPPLGQDPYSQRPPPWPEAEQHRLESQEVGAACGLEKLKLMGEMLRSQGAPRDPAPRPGCPPPPPTPAGCGPPWPWRASALGMWGGLEWGLEVWCWSGRVHPAGGAAKVRGREQMYPWGQHHTHTFCRQATSSPFSAPTFSCLSGHHPPRKTPAGSRCWPPPASLFSTLPPTCSAMRCSMASLASVTAGCSTGVSSPGGALAAGGSSPSGGRSPPPGARMPSRRSGRPGGCRGLGATLHRPKGGRDGGGRVCVAQAIRQRRGASPAGRVP